jgi:alpha-beta hydrolase superfamily lysophospholipase
MELSINEIKINPILQKLRDKPIAGNGENRYFESFDGIKIFYRTWKPSKKLDRIVIVAHGMGGHGEFFALLADHLVNHGIMVVAPDYRNHGYSDGKKGDLKKFKYILEDLNLLIGFIREQHPEIPIFLLGESMGGCVSINLVGLYQEVSSSLSGLILFAPAVKLNFSKKMWIGISALFILLLPVRLFSPSKAIIPTKGREEDGIRNPIHIQYDKEDPIHLDKTSPRYLLNLFRYIRKTIRVASQISIPTLIFQGTDDKGISPDGVRRFYNHVASKDKRIILIEGGYHSLLADPGFQDKWSILIDWLKSH